MALNREEKDYFTQLAAAIVQSNMKYLDEQKKRAEEFEKSMRLHFENAILKLHTDIRDVHKKIESERLWNRVKAFFERKNDFSFRMKKLYVESEGKSAHA